MEKPLLLYLIDLLTFIPYHVVFKAGAAITAYPIFFMLYFFERILFIEYDFWGLNILLAPLKLALSLVPPLVYVVLPFGSSFKFYQLIAETNSIWLALGASIVMFAFIFSLTCFRVRNISHAHPWGYTLKPRHFYQDIIGESLIWFVGLLVTLIWASTIKGIHSMLFNRKPPVKTG